MAMDHAIRNQQRRNQKTPSQMSNWTSITADTLKAAGHGAIVDRAETLATGGTDPVAYAIGASVSRVRRAVAAANDLDSDATKVPRSLEALAVRFALYALCERIGLALTEDQRKARDLDADDLTRLADRKIRVEAPDDIDTNAAPQNRGAWNSESKIIMRSHPVPRPAQQLPPDDDYANPDGPTDTA